MLKQESGQDNMGLTSTPTVSDLTASTVPSEEASAAQHRHSGPARVKPWQKPSLGRAEASASTPTSVVQNRLSDHLCSDAKELPSCRRTSGPDNGLHAGGKLEESSSNVANGVGFDGRPGACGAAVAKPADIRCRNCGNTGIGFDGKPCTCIAGQKLLESRRTSDDVRRSHGTGFDPASKQPLSGIDSLANGGLSRPCQDAASSREPAYQDRASSKPAIVKAGTDGRSSQSGAGPVHNHSNILASPSGDCDDLTSRRAHTPPVSGRTGKDMPASSQSPYHSNTAQSSVRSSGKHLGAPPFSSGRFVAGDVAKTSNGRDHIHYSKAGIRNWSLEAQEPAVVVDVAWHGQLSLRNPRGLVSDWQEPALYVLAQDRDQPDEVFEDTMDMAQLLQPSAKGAEAKPHISREKSPSLPKSAQHTPSAKDTWPIGESTVDLVQLLQPPQSKAPLQDRTNFIGKPLMPRTPIAPSKPSFRTSPIAETTCELAQLLQPASRAFPEGKALGQNAPREHSAAIPEATEDLSELLRSAVSKVPANSQSSRPKPHMHLASSSSSSSGELHLSEEFMDSLEEYIEDSRRDLDEQAADEVPPEEQHDVDRQCDMPHADSQRQGLRRLPGRGRNTNATAAVRETAEAQWAAARHFLSRGRAAGREFLTDLLNYIQAASEQAQLTLGTSAPALRSSLDHPRRHVVVWILKQVCLAVFIMIVIFLIVVEMNWRLGPPPELFY
jgi:hypothetical protein